MIPLWIGISFLVLLALDVWNHRKVKHKASNRVFMFFEGAVALGCLVWWLVSFIG